MLITKELKAKYAALTKLLGVSGCSATDRARYFTNLIRVRRISDDARAALGLALELEDEEVRWGVRAALRRHPDSRAVRAVLRVAGSALPGTPSFGSHVGREVLDAVRTLGATAASLPDLRDEIIQHLEHLCDQAAYPALERGGGANEPARALRAEAKKALRRLQAR